MEASFVSDTINKLKKNDISLQQVAILTRASFQFKDLEDRFIKENIKYKVVGGLRFYERAEIKDALAYFKVLINDSDNLSLERIINKPRRGLGSAFIRKLYDFAKIKKLSLFQSLKLFIESENLNKKLMKH